MQAVTVIVLVVCCCGTVVTDSEFVAHAEDGLASRSSASDWWKHTVVYQIYPRSFQDSDGDGIGDIRGITSRLDYFEFLNVGALWLSPVYKSPMVDFGYDIEDHYEIDPIFGTMADFDELVTEAHKRGIRIIMDFIPNHTSDKHRWFIESRKGGEDNPFSDFYMWHDGKLLENGTRVPPNNWRSCFTGTAWSWDNVRAQFYLHQFAPEQPDLNFRKPEVRQEIENMLEFWLDKGVDGFRIDAIATMFESENILQDEPRSFLEGAQPHEEFYLKHIYTRNLPEIHDIVRQWRALFNRHDARTGRYTFVVTEVYEILEETMKYYFSGGDMPFNFNLIKATYECHATCFYKLINDWLSAMPDGKWPNFVLGNHDRARVTTRKGPQYASAMNVLLLTLPGTPTTYYGEEIGLNDIEVSYNDTQDPWGRNLGPDLYKTGSRDPCRAPMQWDDTFNAGFSTADKTWLPVHPDYQTHNVEAQKAAASSTLNVYRAVAELRKTKAAFHTTHVSFITGNDNVLAFVRYNPDDTQSDPYLIAVNVGIGDASGVGASGVEVMDKSYTEGIVTVNYLPTIDMNTVKISDILLRPGEAIVMQLVADPPGRQEL